MRPLKQLHLLELLLRDCHGMAEALFVPGALPTLKKLRLDDCDEYTFNDRGDIVSLEEVMEAGLPLVSPEVDVLGRAIFGHPSLLEVSGACWIVSMEIPEKLLHWQDCSPDIMDDLHPPVWRRSM